LYQLVKNVNGFAAGLADPYPRRGGRADCLLAAVGSLLALATLATAAALQLGPNGNPAVVLVLGGTGSALVALAYGPAATALRAKAQELCRAIGVASTKCLAVAPPLGCGPSCASMARGDQTFRYSLWLERHFQESASQYQVSAHGGETGQP
jgi:hypothetical protein